MDKGVGLVCGSCAQGLGEEADEVVDVWGCHCSDRNKRAFIYC